MGLRKITRCPIVVFGGFWLYANASIAPVGQVSQQSPHPMHSSGWMW